LARMGSIKNSVMEGATFCPGTGWEKYHDKKIYFIFKIKYIKIFFLAYPLARLKAEFVLNCEVLCPFASKVHLLNTRMFSCKTTEQWSN
jgi:hypothetical protein